MKRRVLVQAGLGSLAVLLMAGTALSQQKKPLSLWYEAASPENQENLKNSSDQAFQRGSSERAAESRFPWC